MIKLENVRKIYKVGTFGGKELHAVSGVSFDVGDGEVVSLIGESGSGKSTIGKMILQLTPITSGSITFNDKEISSLSGAQLKDYYRQVQGVFQDPFSSYNPIFKADRIFDKVRQEYFQNVSSTEWKARVHQALDDVGLNADQVLNKFPHQLSGGQLQRLLIARALLLDIEVLIADEIISMLDASTRIDVLNLLASLKQRGLSILFITHDLSLGYYISEKAVILSQGYVVESGPTESVYNRPYHPYTQMLMSSVPRLDMKWEEVEEHIEPVTAQAALPEGYVYFERSFSRGVRGVGNEPDIDPDLIEVEPGHFVACRRVV